MQRNRLFTSMPLGNNAGTEIRTRLRLRSTVRGANNRLDVDAIMSYDRGSNAATPMLGGAQRCIQPLLGRCQWYTAALPRMRTVLCALERST